MWLGPVVLSLLCLHDFLVSGNFRETSDTTNGNMVFSNSEEGGKLILSTTEFAFDLFRKLNEAKNGGNVFLSPASISMALAMTYLGARAKTAEQMSEVLKFVKVHPDHLHSSFSELRQLLVGGDSYTLHVANKLYGHQEYNFLQEFLDATNKHYGARLESMDFVGNAEGARQSINQWVESQTNSKIKDLLQAGSINALTRLVLVNAIYFKGDWNLKFDPAKTEENDFTMEDGSKVKIPLMHMRKKFNYGLSRKLNVKALELPYVGKKLSMIVLLPEHPNGIGALEKDLTAEHINSFEKSFEIMPEVEVDTFLPRFKLEDSFDLGDTLKGMGMTDAFDATTADFSGMDGTRELSISKVVHKAFLEVNEEGSEAAAATAVVMMCRSMPRVFNFRATHPFLFFIRENETKSVLFLGKFSRPAGGVGGKSEL